MLVNIKSFKRSGSCHLAREAGEYNSVEEILKLVQPGKINALRNEEMGRIDSALQHNMERQTH